MTGVTKTYEYAIYAKWKNGDWFQLNKFYSSPARAIAANNQMAFPANLSRFDDVKIVEREIVHTNKIVYSKDDILNGNIK
jgi:hypothetical protein